MAKKKPVAKKAKKKKAAKKMGRPLKHTPAQAKKIVDRYFSEIEKSDRPPTITGLALALDTSRKVLCEWAEREDDLAAVITRAKSKVELYLEELLTTTKTPAGAIFALKNFGWSDRQEVEVSGNFDVMERLRAGRARVHAERS